MDNRPIGVFDSGLGGLTVVKEIMELLPHEDIVYFGDTARVPYGTRSNETVLRYSEQCIRFLLGRGVKMIVIACNTVSSISLKKVRQKFHLPIVGVIEPGAGDGIESTKNGRLGVIGTEATIRSGAYERAINALEADIKVYSTPCPLFVPIVEEGWSNTKIALLTAERYLDTIKDEDIDTLILGCTHYPLLEGTIGKVMGPEVTLVNPAKGTAREVERILRDMGMLDESKSQGVYSFYVSDLGEKFEEIGGNFLGRKIECAKKIDIEKY